MPEARHRNGRAVDIRGYVLGLERPQLPVVRDRPAQRTPGCLHIRRRGLSSPSQGRSQANLVRQPEDQLQARGQRTQRHQPWIVTQLRGQPHPE